MRIIIRNTACAVAVFLLLSGCEAKKAAPLEINVPAMPPAPASTAELDCLDFITSHMSGGGAIYTNYLGGSTQSQTADGHEVLSESQGIMLRYCAATADGPRFAKTLDYITEVMDIGGLLSYRVQEDGFAYTSNASVDDLRILRGLYEGARVFSNLEYELLCQSWADRLYKTNVQNDFLLDCYDQSFSCAGNVSTLCFSDLETMRLLGAADSRWLSVEKNMRNVLKKGYLGDGFPFYHARRDVGSKAYDSGNINMVEALLTALHLSQVGEGSASTVPWVKNALSDGAVYGEYTTKGEPVCNVESTAIYALCALLGKAENDRDLIDAAIDKMCALQVVDKNSLFYGAFANEEKREAYSFDNLMALCALRAQAQYLASLQNGGVV